MADYQSRDSLESILKEYKIQKKTIDKLYIRTLIDLSREYRFIDNETSFKILDTSLKIVKSNFIGSVEHADIHNMYGNLFFDVSQNGKAVDNYYECLQIHRSLNNPGGVAFSYNDIAYVYYERELYELALKYYQKALPHAKQDDDPHAYIHTCKSLAFTYSRVGKTDSAFYFIDKAINYKADDKYKILGQSYYYKSLIFRRNLKQMDSAKTYVNKSLDVIKDKNLFYWPEGYFALQMELAYLNQKLGLSKKALKNLDLAENYLYKNDLLSKVSDVDVRKARIFMSINNYDSAEIYFKKALWLSSEEDQIYNLIRIYKNLMKTYKFKNSKDSFYLYTNKYLNLKDSILNDDKFRITSFLTTSILQKDSEYENERLTEQNTRQYILIIIIFFLAVFITTLILLRYRNNKKNLTKLEEANKKLTTTNHQLDEANLTKLKFFEIIAHDLKSPVTAFKGSLELVLKDLYSFEEEELKTILGELLVSASQVQDLILSLLTWARIKTGNFNFDISKTNINLLLEAVIKEFSEKSEENDIIINNNLNEDLEIEIDPSLIHTIIKELITNSMKFTRAGGQVNINYRKDHIYHYLIVSDTGIGMADKDIDKLFKIERSWSRIGLKGEKGTGLGLLICKEFIELHGGYINVDSELNEGTEVTITIPVSFSS